MILSKLCWALMGASLVCLAVLTHATVVSSSLAQVGLLQNDLNWKRLSPLYVASRSPTDYPRLFAWQLGRIT